MLNLIKHFIILIATENWFSDTEVKGSKGIENIWSCARGVGNQWNETFKLWVFVYIDLSIDFN